MHQLRAEAVRLCSKTDGHEAVAVYADWLEEQGDPRCEMWRKLSTLRGPLVHDNLSNSFGGGWRTFAFVDEAVLGEKLTEEAENKLLKRWPTPDEAIQILETLYLEKPK